MRARAIPFRFAAWILKVMLLQMDFPAQLDTVGPFLVGAALGATSSAVPYLRRRYHQWRLAHRLRANPYLQVDELREYEQAIGDELPPPDPLEIARGALLMAAGVGIPLWAAGTSLASLWNLGWLVVGAVGLFLAIWRRLNDPPELRAGTDGFPEVEVPREAWLGLVGGIGMVALILLFIAVLV